MPDRVTERVTVPDNIRERAALFRFAPESSSFKIEGGPDLGIRKSPYTFALPDADDIVTLEDMGEDPIELKLHALQCRWLQEEENARFHAWAADTSDGGQIVEVGIAELHARIHAWCALAGDERWTRWGASVREVYLNWGAIRIAGLIEELAVRERGRDEYIAAYCDGPAEAQCNLDIEDGLEEEEDLFAEKYV